ncbi:enoyl-CoA hydratase-related protein [Streptomyces olivochromogenes]|uniref:enoyl-CoA hydratase-related protein n=1 Tax=Streptomyces olivochromogenes TaxID=1963 RepID=UPI001F18A15F|nr:enoyl-CoA hydratase-related protein [Streptomyces olivochromogenes]MCF3133826.1 enoyl-CoA hydratase/isomerase family protein [Streptomyces olivochromogenes]
MPPHRSSCRKLPCLRRIRYYRPAYGQPHGTHTAGSRRPAHRLRQGTGRAGRPPSADSIHGASTGSSTKPVITAVHGRCFTAGLELALNSEICIAAGDTVFGQQEVTRGIVALGGATVRLPHRAGWGNAMRHLLTGDQIDAQEAWRMGIVQEVVPAGHELDRALELAHRIAAQARLAVQATPADARSALAPHIAASAAGLRNDVGPRLFATADAAEGIASLIERRVPTYEGI